MQNGVRKCDRQTNTQKHLPTFQLIERIGLDSQFFKKIIIKIPHSAVINRCNIPQEALWVDTGPRGLFLNEEEEKNKRRKNTKIIKWFVVQNNFLTWAV